MKAKVKIKAIYSWFNVYVNEVMILSHLSSDDIIRYISILHKTNTPYDLFV